MRRQVLILLLGFLQLCTCFDYDYEDYEDYEDDNSEKTELAPTQPYFSSAAENVTVVRGESALLKCQVEDLGVYAITWGKKETKYKNMLLTINKRMMKTDSRMSLSNPAENKWYLSIDNVEDADEGFYICTAFARDKISTSIYLKVMGKVAKKLEAKLKECFQKY